MKLSKNNVLYVTLITTLLSSNAFAMNSDDSNDSNEEVSTTNTTTRIKVDNSPSLPILFQDNSEFSALGSQPVQPGKAVRAVNAALKQNDANEAKLAAANAKNAENLTKNLADEVVNNATDEANAANDLAKDLQKDADDAAKGTPSAGFFTKVKTAAGSAWVATGNAADYIFVKPAKAYRANIGSNRYYQAGTVVGVAALIAAGYYGYKYYTNESNKSVVEEIELDSEEKINDVQDDIDNAANKAGHSFDHKAKEVESKFKKKK